MRFCGLCGGALPGGAPSAVPQAATTGWPTTGARPMPGAAPPPVGVSPNAVPPGPVGAPQVAAGWVAPIGAVPVAVPSAPVAAPVPVAPPNASPPLRALPVQPAPPAEPPPAIDPIGAAAPRSVEDAHGAPEQERRVVSVLFTDMSGSTAMAEKMDPEEFTSIVNDLFARLGACIHRYDGHIDKYIGDAIMATFGAPIAHDNDPERAILAALEMQDEVRRVAARLHKRTGVLLQMRVGINSGEVIAGHVGSEAKAEYTVMGDTVNTASRLEHAAPVGGVLVSESTYEATRALFNWRVPEPITVKGKSEPLKVFEPTGRATGPRGVRGIAWTRTPYVGRQGLLDDLVTAYRKVIDRRSAVFAVAGEAGLGKTRLRHEFSAAVERAGLEDDALFLLGRCLPYAQGNSYGAINSLLRTCFELGKDAVDRDTFVAAMESHGLGAEAIETLLPMLTGGAVRGALDRLPPDQWQQLAFATIREIVHGIAATRPVILFFEDLHWIDPSSRDLLSNLIANTHGQAVLFFLIFRPDLAEPPVWRAHPGYSRHDLEPLKPEESRALINAILPGIEFPTGLLDQVIARAAGNPFYIEEIVKSFESSGAIRREGDLWVASNEVEQFVVPETIQAILRPRIDQLEEQSRRVLQQAAVVGRYVPRPLLEAITDVRPLEPPLADLERAELIRQSDDGTGFTFRTVLAQEVAYSILLLRRRRAYHRRAADAYERFGADAQERYVDDLAYHYAMAEVWPKALLFGRRAGDRARALYANAEAILHYRRCVTAIDRLEELLASEWPADRAKEPELADLNRQDLVLQRRDIVVQLAEVHALLGQYDEALATFGTALELAENDGDLLAHLHLRVAEAVHEKRAQWQEALQSLLRARECQGRASADPGLDARIDIALGRVYWRLNRLEEARAIVETRIGLLEGTNLNLERARAYRQLGNLAAATGDFTSARDNWENGLAVASETEDGREVAPFLQNLGVAAFRLGDPERARQYFERLNALCERIGDIWMQSTALGSLGGAARARNEIDAAVEFYERSARIKARIGDPRGVMIAYNNIAEALADRGDLPEAIATLDRSLAIARENGAHDKVPYIQRLTGEYRLQTGDIDQAERLATEAIDSAKITTDRMEEALSGRLLGRVALARQHARDGADLLAAAVDALRGLKNPHDLGVTLLDLADACIEFDQGDRAQAALVEAEPLIARAGTAADKARLAQLREALAAPAA